MARKLILNIVVLGLAVVCGLMLSVRPWKLYREQLAKTKTADTQVRKVEGERADLKRQLAKSESAIGREEQLRERGYRKPNERPIEVGR